MSAEDNQDLRERKISHALLWRGVILLLTFTLAGNATAQTCIQPPANLVSWWPGDANADDIIGTNNGTLHNGVTFVPGIVGQAFSFNGVDQFIELPSTNALYNPVTGFTWDAWVRPAALGEMVVLGAADHINCEDIALGIGGFAELGAPPDHVIAHVDSIGACGARGFLSAPVPGGIQPGTDYHLALTVDYPNSIAHLYIDGQQVAARELTGTLIARDMLVTIGAFRDGGNPLVRPFSGLIDEVEIYNRPLTDQEIQDIFNAGSAGKCKPQAFATFTARAELKLGPQAEDDSFKLKGYFKLAASSNGIDPIAEDVTVQLGTFSKTIPAGSFQSGGPGFKYWNQAEQFGVWIKPTSGQGQSSPQVQPNGHQQQGSYEVSAVASAVNLNGTVSPPKVGITIGDDFGPPIVPAPKITTTITVAVAEAPQTICHFPPGNPANVQIITVGAPAVQAHIAHHNDAVCADGDSDCCFGGSGPSVCTNFATDVNNCGSCGSACSAGSTCTDGACVGGCDSGLTSCGGQCVDTTTDPNNCGACGHVCDNGEPVCAGGSCECVAGGEYGDYFSCDPSGATASGFEVCVRCDEETHKCVASPDNIYCFHTGICCGGRCTMNDEQFDPENCGACGTACDIGDICYLGGCCVPADPGCDIFCGCAR